ncbi:MAG: hypothetical protein HFF53_00555 [Lawsonibacter sp.]|nr:hypothetical protein [Lawsonibacter sp.]
MPEERGMDQGARADPEERQRARRASQQRRRRNSVFQYIAVMFMAAFALLLITFLMERRQSQQQIDDLKQSASAVQTLKGLMEENESLKRELNEVQSQLSAQQERIRQQETSRQDLQEQLDQEDLALQAMHWFWQLNDAYVRGRTAQCRTLITSMEEAGLQEALPRENVTGTDRFSPYDRYMEIRGRIVK